MERNITQLEGSIKFCWPVGAGGLRGNKQKLRETVAIVEKQPCSYRNVQELFELPEQGNMRQILQDSPWKEFGGNFDYMNRTFKKVTGQTIFKYLNRVR